MRFDAIVLPSYGPFTDVSLDLRQGKNKLEIIYGPNEAGKSSLLRAISDFLFGIPGQTRDDFIHGYKSLRIRATIERARKRLECVRRKANTNSLRAADDEELISEELFRSFVPIASRDVFQNMFGLDAERLQQGGEELLKGQSEFGQLLFSAAAGIEGLYDILKKLTDETDRLFKPRASTSVVAKILDRLKGSKDRLRETQVTLTAWNKLQEDYQAAESEVSGLDADIFSKQEEFERLKRIQVSLGLLSKRADLRDELRGVENARILRDGFSIDHHKAASDLVIKTGQVQEATRRVLEINQQIDAIVLPNDLLAREKVILSFHEETGRHRKDAADRLRLQTELREAESELAHLLRSLGEQPDLARVPDLVVRAADKRLVQELCNARASLDAEARNGQESVADERRKLGVAREQLAAHPPAVAVASLRGAVQRALVTEASEVKARSLQKTAAEDLRKIVIDVKALPWPSDVTSLENSDLPAHALVAEWTGRMDKAEQAVELAQNQLQATQAEILTLEKDLVAASAGRSIPTLSQLAEDRRHRDLGWSAVRGAWLEGGLDSADAREFLHHPVEGISLANAYEESVFKTDDTGDRLRAEADQVAKLEQVRAALNRAGKETATRDAELSKAQAGRGRLETEWQELWRPFQVNAGAPHQMVDWLQRRARIVDRLRAVQQSEAEASRLIDEGQAAKRDLQDRLAEIENAGGPTSDSLSAWRSLAERIAQTLEDLAKQRQDLTKTIEASERALTTAEARVGTADSKLDLWKQKWAELMANLRLPGSTETLAAQEIIRVRDELQACAKTAQSHQTRITGIERDFDRFRAELRSSLESVAPDLLSVPELDAVRELYQRLTQAQHQRNLREAKSQDLEREQKTLVKVELDRKQAEGLLSALMAEAKCTDGESLPGMIEASTRRKDLEKKLEEAEEQLAVIGGGRSVAKLEEEACGIEADQIPWQLEQTNGRLGEMKTRLKSVEEKRITLGNDLKRMEENSDSCSAAADIEACKAEALDAAEQYIRLQLARIILQGAVEQYREKTQGDMLKRSSHLFSVLTVGAFSGLKLDWDDAGNVVVVGARALTGESVAMDGMSDGTRDQLYLALRLASMELYARDHEPIPFILDDILIQFDDARSVAAIRALAGLAQHTQVLLFTHHKHLVDLAQANLEESQFTISEIACGLGTALSAVAVS